MLSIANISKKRTNNSKIEEENLLMIDNISKKSTKSRKIEENDMLSTDGIIKQSTDNSKIEDDDVLSIYKIKIIECTIDVNTFREGFYNYFLNNKSSILTNFYITNRRKKLGDLRGMIRNAYVNTNSIQ